MIQICKRTVMLEEKIAFYVVCYEYLIYLISYGGGGVRAPCQVSLEEDHAPLPSLSLHSAAYDCPYAEYFKYYSLSRFHPPSNHTLRFVYVLVTLTETLWLGCCNEMLKYLRLADKGTGRICQQ
jgi:hypothetical protein